MTLTAAEVNDIRTSWKPVQANPTESAVAILAHFLEKYPSNIDKFPWFAGTPVEELKENARFKTHAGRILKVFDDSVIAADNEAELKRLWTELAQTHFKRAISRKSYQELKTSVVDVLTPTVHLNDSQKAAWGKFFDTVYGILFAELEHMEKA